MIGGYSPQLYRGIANQQHIITLQFELQREKQKNQILQERMRSTQLFILQMKEMQVQLQNLNQRCRAQLQDERRIRHNLQNNELRSYSERVAQLQHEIKVLSNLKENQVQARSKENNSVFKKVHRSKEKTHSHLKDSPHFKKQSKSKYEEKRKSSHRDNKYDEQNSKLKKFTSQFISMSQVYLGNEVEGLSESKKLKHSWKWIKDVVREWDQRNQQQSSLSTFVGELEQLLQLQKTGNTKTILQTIEMLISLEKEEQG